LCILRRGFKSKRKRGNVEEQKSLFYFAAKDAALISCTEGNAFIRVDAFERLFAHEFFYSFLYGRNSCRTAHQKNLIKVAGFKSAV